MDNLDWGESSYTESSSSDTISQTLKEPSTNDIKIEDNLYQDNIQKEKDIQVEAYSIDRPTRITIKAKISHD